MSGSLTHIRIGKELKQRMQKLIKQGLFTTESELAREGIRSIILKYSGKKDEKQ